MSAGQKQSVSAAAEALFETKNVAEIRKIEAQTRREIDDKNQQLRQLVGDSYRDLIEGTDKIIDISTKCHGILSNILTIQEGFGSLAVSVTGAGGAQEGKDFVRKHQELHAVGARVKFILDTPEVLWGCLDGQQHLEAARRLLRVHEVHAHLQGACAADIAAKFPLISHQWPVVLKFREQILDVSTSTLSSKPSLSSQEAADAVAALALLQGLSSAAALQQLLGCRKQWVQQRLQQALSAAAAAQQEPGAVLAELAQQVQSCIAQVGELFTASAPSMPGSSSSLLQQVLQEDEADASELYFGSMDTAGEGSNSPEAVAWRQKSSAACQQLTPLQRSQVEQACSAWLADVAAACSEHGLQLLQCCSSAHSLLDAEQAVQLAIAEWSPAQTADAAAAAGDAAALDVQATSDQASTAAVSAGNGSGSRLGRAGSSAAGLMVSSGKGSAAAGSPRALGGRVLSEWDVTCERVLGQKLDLWQVLFHAAFLERAKAIIADCLQDAAGSIHEPLRSALKQAAAHPAEPAGQLQPGSWPSAVQLQGPGQLDRTYTALGGRSSSMAWAGGAQGGLGYSRSGQLLLGSLSGMVAGEAEPAAFRSEVSSIKQLFDARLHAALQAVLLLTGSPVDEQDAAAAAAGGISRSTTATATSLTAAAARTGSLPTGMARAGSIAPAAAATAFSNSSSSPVGAAAACAAAGKARSAELQQYAQQQCVELMQKLAGQLQQQLQQLPAAAQGAAGAPVVEQVLLLARLCHALATGSTMLPALLGPPEAWPAAAKAGPDAAAAGSGSSSNALPASIAQGMSALGPAAAALLRMHHPSLMGQQGGSSAAAAAAASQLAALQQQLHGIACSGYSTWAAWVASSLSAALLAALKADELLHSSTAPLSWIETCVTADGSSSAAASLLDPLEGDGGGAGGGDMRFSLPGCPSSALLQMLSLACSETRRAGEHLISADALQLLQWELHGAALAALQQLGSSSNGSQPGATAADGGNSIAVSEKGVLQLLFDQRLLRDVLGGSKPPAADAAAAAAAGAGAAASTNGTAGAAGAAARKRLVQDVEQQLQDQLDPIDWATYEPHLWANVQRYHGRTAVLLGMLGQLHKPYAYNPRPAAGAASSELNALNVLPVAARFHYLPISTPTAIHAGAAAAKQRALSMGPGGAGLPGFAGKAAAGAALAAAAAAGDGGSGRSQASDLAAQYVLSELGSGSSGMARASPGLAGDGAAAAAAGGAQAVSQLHLSADAAAAAGASALSALQARLQGSGFGAFGSLLGDRAAGAAAEVSAMAQNFGDLLPSAGLGGGILSSFSRRDGTAGSGSGQAAVPGSRK